jgi:alkanesulfonate monooxygenase SsuD/methylene tetrahydromethanopterin reductase-like flavin-dependent oxidoreductase (luciferase family)
MLGPMASRFGAAFWIQRTGWPELRAATTAAEAAGFDEVWLDDHLLCDEGDWHDAKLEGWSALAAVAAVTARVRLGLLVSANTFRNPGLTAKLATTLDHISGGRAILGLGAGWFEREHEAFGLDFGATPGARVDRLVEVVPLIRRLLDGEVVTHHGEHADMVDAICRPVPIQPHLPILIGGKGPRKTVPLIARSADLWNTYGTPARLAELDGILRTACVEVGRDPATIDRSVYLNACIRDDPGEAARAWSATRDSHRPQSGEDRGDAIGTLDDVAAALRAFAAVGFDHPIFVFRAPFDLETMARLPELRTALAAR